MHSSAISDMQPQQPTTDYQINGRGTFTLIFISKDCIIFCSDGYIYETKGRDLYNRTIIRKDNGVKVHNLGRVVATIKGAAKLPLKIMEKFAAMKETDLTPKFCAEFAEKYMEDETECLEEKTNTSFLNFCVYFASYEHLEDIYNEHVYSYAPPQRRRQHEPKVKKLEIKKGWLALGHGSELATEFLSREAPNNISRNMETDQAIQIVKNAMIASCSQDEAGGIQTIFKISKQNTVEMIWKDQIDILELHVEKEEREERLKRCINETNFKSLKRKTTEPETVEGDKTLEQGSWKMASHPSLEANKDKLVVMIVLDTWCYNKDNPYYKYTPILNKVAEDASKNDRLRTLRAYGKAVGLPADDLKGNCKVSHNSLGAGRINLQGPNLIDKAFESGAIYEGEGFSAIKDTFESGTLHIIGLLSDSGIYSRIDHLKLMIIGANREGARKIRVHILIDGHTKDNNSILKFLESLETTLHSLKDVDALIASGSRELKFDEKDDTDVKDTIEAIVFGNAQHKFKFASQALKTICEITSTFVIVDDSGEAVGKIDKSDSTIIVNYTDNGLKMLFKAFEDGLIEGLSFPKFRFVSMIQYNFEPKHQINYFVPAPKINKTLREYLVQNGVSIFACSDTKKFPYVTFFWDGNRSKPLSRKEKHEEIKMSPKVYSSYYSSIFSLGEVANKAIEAIKSRKYKHVHVYLPSDHVVGHLLDDEIEDSKIDAYVKTNEAVENIIGAIAKVDGIYVIIASYGVEDAKNEVPIAIGGPGLISSVKFHKHSKRAGLANVAAAVLNLHGLEAPKEYRESLIEVVEKRVD